MNQKNYTKTNWFRGIAFVLAFLLAMPTALANVSTVSAEETAAFKYGDVDGDGVDNAKDALLVLQHAAKITTLEGDKFKAGDVDGNGKLDAKDALLILQKAAVIIDRYPVEDMPEDTATPVVTATPDGSVEETATPEVTTTPPPTRIPSEPPTPVPTATPDMPEVVWDETDIVKGIPVEIENLNGAELYTDDPNGSILTFTDKNAQYREGIKIVNPIKGKEDLVHSYADLRSWEDPTGQGRENVFNLAGSVIGWGNDENKLPVPEDQLLEDPTRTTDLRVNAVPREDEVYYPTADTRKGFSMSFWSKTDKDQDNSALVVFANATQTVSINVNAQANYVDGNLQANKFETSQHANDPNYVTGKWHYYTVTFANDWIQVYIDGIEVRYDEVTLTRDDIGDFNNGFMTRYNTAVTWPLDGSEYEDEWQKWRGYILKQKGEHKDYPSVTNDEFTVWGNGRYRGLHTEERLLLTFMTGQTTKVYIGGFATEIASGNSKYSSNTGSQVAQVMWYDCELTKENVRANYSVAVEPVYVPPVSTDPVPTETGGEIVVTDTPKPVDPLDGTKVDVKDPHSGSYDEATGVYTFNELKEEGEVGEKVYNGVQFRNPFELNTNVTQTIEEALAGQELFPTSVTPNPDDPEADVPSVVAGNSDAVQYWRGNYYSDYYYGDITKYGNVMEDAEKNPATATIKTAFHRPVWTKGASVGFWFNPTQALIDSTDPIFTMGKTNEYFFTLTADGTVQYYDGQPVSFRGGQQAFKVNAQCYNQFTASGDPSKVKANEWNYYLITFANDWIQVYVNGEEMVYKLAGLRRGLTKQFNAGFLTRYNQIGMITEDPDTTRQYIKKAGGLTTVPETIDETFNGNDETSIRANGVYSKGYIAEGEKTEFGSTARLMMDSLTVEGGNFYMGGYNTSYKNLGDNKTYNSNAIKRFFYTDHNIADGSAFADVRFYELEANAEEAKTIYDRRVVDSKPGPTPEPTDTPEPTTPAPATATPPVTDTPPATETVPPTDTPVPTNEPAAPITYDAETDTYTMHGVGKVYDDKKALNGSYELDNPFAGLDLDEEITLNESGYPVYNNGVTISYWVNVPEEAKDALLFKFELKDQQIMHPDDQYKMDLCKAYSEEDTSYALGTEEIYVAIADDGTETEYKVLNGYGKNVRYNPNYPAEGLYTVDAEKGTIDVIKKGADASVETNWTKIKNIGEGYYAAYSVRYTDEGGEVSKIREGKVTSQLHLYASGSLEFWGDDLTGLNENANAGATDASVKAAENNKLIMWANGAPANGGPYDSSNGASIPTLVSELGKWHFVTIKITNDAIQYYVDGTKLGVEFYNWWAQPMSKQWKNFKAFNYGYGFKDNWRTNNPEAYRFYSKSLMSIITDRNTTLEIGGQNISTTYSGMGTVGTPEGVQIKEVKFYNTPVADENITAEGIVNVEPIDYSKPAPLTLKELNKSATVDDNGVYTFGDLVSEGQNTINKVVDGVATDVVYDLYYGVEFENPFAGNKRIQQSVVEALEGQTIYPHNDANAHENNFAVDKDFGDTWKDAEGNEYPYHRPVYTKGATVSFWYNPADVNSNAPIYTMYGQNEGLFVLLADGTVAYFDMCAAEWKNAQFGWLGASHNTNAFFAQGNADAVKEGEWNYYTVTFANDWIQVYVNGEELVYDFVALELQNKTMGNHFNGGYGYRYSPTGMLTEEVDETRQYATKIQGILTAATAEDGTVTYTDPLNARNIAVRSTSVYRRAQHYRPVEDRGEQGEFFVLMMDRLTSENMRFFIGGYPTEMSMALNAKLTEAGYNPTKGEQGPGNKVKIDGISIDTNHNQKGSQFKDVTFAEIEMTADEVKAQYDAMMNPITYDEETDTYTMHGQNNDPSGTNSSYAISNPFAGKDLDEAITLNEAGYPVYTKGVTIGYWVNVPATAKDALLFKFELKDQQIMHPDDQYKMDLVKAYAEDNADYAMGTSEVYVAIADDGTETEYTVLSGYGKNVRYNPNYPAEGLYTVDAEKGTIDVIKKGADASVEANWTKIKNIGEGYYVAYSVRYTDEGGEVSKIREGKVTSQLHLYASGSLEFWGDDLTGIQENPNAGNYGSSVKSAENNKLIMWANGAPANGGPYDSSNGEAINAMVTAYDQWHYVAITIANDCIQYYVDGEKLGVEYYNWWAQPMSKQWKNFKAFNYGYGFKDNWRTNNPEAYRFYSKSLMNILTDENTTLEIGGQNLSTTYSGMGTVGTPDGVQIKGLEFFDYIVDDQYITNEGIDVINDITYDAETDTYTMHGQNFDDAATNASLEIDNPFAGKDLDEEITLDENGYPVYTKGVTMGYWVNVPAEAKDAILFKFSLADQQIMHPDDQYKMDLVKAYTEDNADYAMGTSEVYVAIADDGTETEYTVLSGYGKNVRYNPNYPAEGLYTVDAEKGTIDVIKKGADASVEANWTKIKNIGEGYYAAYSVRYTDEGGEVSKIREGKVTSQLHLYASGSLEFWGDDLTGIQENPNAGNYGSSVKSAENNKLIMWANGAPANGGPYDSSNGEYINSLVTEYDQWHYVAITIANDCIQYYVDGQKLGVEYYNWWAQPMSKQWKNFKAFNYGYGFKDNWRTNNPEAYRFYSKSLMEIITDENTKLEIGGQNLSTTYSGMGTVKTPAGVQIKGLEFFDYVVPEAFITETGIDTSKAIELEVANLNSSTTVDEEGVYTFGEPVAQGTNKITKTVTNENGEKVQQEVEYGLYYGVEFENPFVGNTRIQQTVLEALEGQEVLPYNLTDSRAVNNGGVVGREGNFYLNSPIGHGDTYTTEDGTKTYTYQRPVYTKGATVNFWYNPADVTSHTPIFTMYGENESLFVLLADGTVAYFDMCNAEWKNPASWKGAGHCTNGFFAQGDATKVAQGEWNYYTVTFANDWIQVYINGEELVYQFVSLELQAKTLGVHFNGGYGYRYSPTGMLTEETDPRQYITKSTTSKDATKGGDGILDTVVAEDGTTTLADPSDIARVLAVRSTSVYRRAQGYWAEEDKGDNGVFLRLMMDRLTSANMKFYIGGVPTLMSDAMSDKLTEAGFNPTKMEQGAGNKVAGVDGIGINTNHGQAGSQFKDVTFVEKELTAEEVKALYNEINAVPLTEEVKTLNNATLDAEGVYTFTDPVAAETGYTYVSGGSEKTIDAYYGIELNNPFAGNTNVKQAWSEILTDEQMVFKGTWAGSSVALQQKWGSYGDVYYGDIAADLAKAESEGTLDLSAIDKSIVTNFYKPTWTKGATINFWFKPNQATMDTLAAGNIDAIYSMFDEGKFVFMLAADGSLTWQDLSAKEWGGNPKSVLSSRNGQSANQFTVLGDASKVKVGEWNYYTVTFANDWIQVYINGEEVVYKSVGFNRTYCKDFNGSYMTRYNNIGQIFEDTDPRQYMTLSGGISTEGTDNDKTAIRATGVYASGYNAQTETSQGTQYTLLMDALTSETAVAYIGGCPSPLNNTAGGSARHTKNAVKGAFSMEHNLAEGNAYTGFTFVEKELTAEEVATSYTSAVAPQ